MDNLNRRYNQTNNAMIGFYMKCDPTYINNSIHVTKTFTGASLLMATNNDGGSFNVHIIRSFASATTAGFSIPFLNASMIPSGSYLSSTANGDLAHEIGHLLGLAHTHQYSAWNWKCLTECVSRTRTWPTFNLCPTRLISNRVCEATGDGLRDTQADDNLVSNNACFYNVSFGNDVWGDSYDNPPAGLQDRPNINNIMSYNSATDCVDHFSRLQIAVMLWTLYHKKPNNFAGWRNPISTFDNYEPDNDAITARNIQVNEIQERNFHQQWNRVAGLGYTTQCDVDWVRFTPTCSSGFDVETFENIGRTKANTRLTIFDANLNQLAQNDDISVTNQFSKINYALVAGQNYFFRIENLSSNTTGYYNLRVAPGFTMSGNSTICTSGIYSVNNLPTGAVVTWSALPLGIVSFNPVTGSSTTVTKQSNGIVAITATVTNSCANGTITNDNIVVGTPTIYSTYTYNGSQNPIHLWGADQYYNPVCNSITTQISSAIQGASSVTWSKVTSNPSAISWSQTSNGVQFYLWAVGQTAIFEVDASNGCGTTTQQYGFQSISCGGGGGCLLFAISPNPAQGTLKVIVPKIPAPCGIATTNISKSISALGISEIKIYDQNGILQTQKKYNKLQQATLDISFLKAGVYFVDISGGTTTERQQVIIQN